MQDNNQIQTVNESTYGSMKDIVSALRNISQNGKIPVQQAIRMTGIGGMMTDNPYIQNRRVKSIGTLPEGFGKDKVAEMLRNPYSSEQPLRAVAHALEFSAYPIFHIRKVYQDLLTYHSYIEPVYASKDDVKRDDFWREWKLLDKLRNAFDLKSTAHQIVGQTLQEGKVFYYPRFDVDKSHNSVNYAFFQQLPSDWTKIVGFNNVSKYTIAFNLMYFTLPGTTPTQFGDLFTPYIDDFFSIVKPSKQKKGRGGVKTVWASATVDMERARILQERSGGTIDVYQQNGRWFYWVTLPPDEVFTFEVDDANTAVISPFTGLFLDMIQLSAYEAIQLELVQNPLVALVTGEIPYRDSKDAQTDDDYKLSNSARELFLALWAQLMASTNTGGIGFYAAPFENMTLHQLSEAPSAMEISSNGYAYTMSKAGLTAIIPSAKDTRAGVAQISLEVESRFAECVYGCMERAMRAIIQRLGLRYEWRMRMFGTLHKDAELKKECREDMTLGIQSSALVYNALHDRSILDDICISDAIAESGLLDRRLPLVTSYSAKSPESELPPQAKNMLNEGGRPELDEVQSEGGENDIDSYGE